MLRGKKPLPRLVGTYPDKLMVWGAIGKNFRALVCCKGTSPGLNGCVVFTRAGKKQFVPRRKRDSNDDLPSRINMTSEWYKRVCLSGKVVQHIKSKNLILMQDGAGIHTAKHVLKFLETQRVPVLPWPARSPDLNPIERIWAILAQRVATHHPQTIDDLVTAVRQEFFGLSESTIDGVIGGVRRRIREVIALKGGW